MPHVTTYENVGSSFTTRAAQVVWYLVGIIQVILGLRFILRLVGANPAAGFTDFVYAVSQPFMAPFENVVRNVNTAQGSVFDWNALIAMIVYWLLAWAIVSLFFVTRSNNETVRREKTTIVDDDEDI